MGVADVRVRKPAFNTMTPRPLGASDIAGASSVGDLCNRLYLHLWEVRDPGDFSMWERIID